MATIDKQDASDSADEAAALAIIGMSGRFPGATNLDTFWQNLVNGVKSIRQFSREELLAAGIAPEVLDQGSYVRAGSPLAGIEDFDAGFFGYTPREAEVMDPQQRLFLECAWEALEDAAYDTARFDGLIGAFAGSGFGAYLFNNIYPNSELIERVGKLQVELANERDALATMVSYKLNLKGPAIAVQTFCSTSLVAVHLACQSLLSFECDLALAGGVAIDVPQVRGYLYEEGGILSSDGECRTFDASASGSVMGSGVGVVALKRLVDAREDGDHIYAVIRGTAVNNDGGLRASYTAPGLNGQKEVIAEALGNAGVAAESIQYIEAHGTATMLGDAVELAAMIKAFEAQTQKKQFCALGSVKPNIGHLDRASGVTGLMKTALSLKHKKIPASLNFEHASADIHLAQSPFYVNTMLSEWKRLGEVPRRAGVSSFGLGGTNAHVVLEEAPLVETTPSPRTHQLVLLSAKSETALTAARRQLGTFLETHPEAALADVAYTLGVGRTTFNHRCIAVARDGSEAASALLAPDASTSDSLHQTRQDRSVAFLFADVHMLPLRWLRDLRTNEPVFRDAWERCTDMIQRSTGWHGLEILSSAGEATLAQALDNETCLSTFPSAANEARKRERIQQLAAFVCGYAFAELLNHWGITPHALLASHSNEYLIACIAGVFSFEDALRLLLWEETELPPGYAIALHPPRTPYISPMTETWISDELATDPSYWRHQRLPHTQASAQAIAGLGHEDGVLLLLGAGASVQYAENTRRALLSLEEFSYAGTLMLLGKLWLAGVSVDWLRFYAAERRGRLSLPTYPFERQRYWVEPPRKTSLPGQTQPSGGVAAGPKKLEPAQWFSLPGWRRVPLLTEGREDQALLTSSVLLFANAEDAVQGVLEYFVAHAQHVTVVYRGEHFARLGENKYMLRPGVAEDYVELCRTLAALDVLPTRVLHCWNVTRDGDGRDRCMVSAADFQRSQEEGFYSLCFLARALAHYVYTTQVSISVASNGVYSVTGKEPLQPEKATLVGACKVITQEYTQIVCKSIDLHVAGSRVDHLALAREASSSEPIVAYRDGERWVQTFEPGMLVPSAGEARPPLRRRGVYLITGGLGRVGRVLAHYLAKAQQARLVLIGRTWLPAREDWSQWLRTHGARDTVSAHIRYIQSLEELGAVVLFMQADVANLTQMQQVMSATHATFGALHGVIHAAGVSTDASQSTIDALTIAACEEQFVPKVHGLLALEQVLPQEELDFCVVFSSLSAVLGGLGLAAYAAANLFMDVYVQKHNRTAKIPWTCVNWDTWQVDASQHGPVGATISPYVMSPEEGIDALLRVLAGEHRHIVNSVGDLQARIRQWVLLETLDRDRGSGEKDAHVHDRAECERALLRIWRETLGIEQIGLYENFFELGGNSLIGLQLIARIRKAFRVQIPTIALFEAPTINAMTQYLQASFKEQPAQEQLPRREERRKGFRQAEEGIAVIGMSGRFPGAKTVEQFWQNLRNGAESFTLFSEEELLAAGVSPSLLSNPDYVRGRPVLDDVEYFDARFFGYSPREAELMDPQHRLFLECAWESLEHAGYDPSRYDGLIGVFAGTNVSSYLHSIISKPEVVQSLADAVNGYQVAIGTDKDALTTTVSYKLNLKGPSFAVQTFCSTSLVAVHLACQSLLLGESDMALAGGVSVRVPVKEGHFYQAGGMESPDGHCRAFDAKGRGCAFGDGAGVVVLKRLAEALADGDMIYAVVKGSAINNDGSLKVSYSAPGVSGQAAVVTAALARAGVEANSISYVEAHGTATELGDPIEVASLTRAFRAQTERTGYCALGSVKTNVGHLDRAAGVTSLLKVALALHHRELPPSLHFSSPNPSIDFEQSPFYVNTQLLPWPGSSTPRRAGINSLGMGGTNAHVVVEEGPEPVASGPSRPWQLLMLSARSESALSAMRSNLAHYLGQHAEVPLADVAYTLQCGRKRFEQRRVLLCRDREEALQQLAQDASQQSDAHEDRSLVFLFPGLSELRAGVVQELYAQEAVFRDQLDHCCELLRPELGLDLRQLLVTSTTPLANHHALHNEQAVALFRGKQQASSTSFDDPLLQTELAHPALFVIEYALAQLLLHWGVRPAAMLGYSLGEYVAACLAGVFSLEDALKLVARRARLIQAMPPGAMLAVPLAAREVAPYISEQIELAALNGPATSILAGPGEAIAALQQRFERAGVITMPIQAKHAFHTSHLAPLREPLTALLKGIELHAPSIAYISNVTGTWISAEQATDPGYWANHMCQPVQLMQGLKHVLQAEGHLLLEVGPGRSLLTAARQHPDCASGQHLFSTLAAPYERQTDEPYLLTTLGKLWQHGVNVDWRAFYSGEDRRRVPLPTYPFERQRYWLPPADARDYISPGKQEIADRIPDLSDWFYLPSWQQSPLTSRVASQGYGRHNWLLLVDECGVGEALKQRLLAIGQHVTTLEVGQAFSRREDAVYTIRPDVSQDYSAVLRELRAEGRLPERIVHLWSVGEKDGVRTRSAQALVERSFYSLMLLARTLGDLGLDECQLSIISTDMQDVTGDERIQAEKATLIGPCKVIPQEYPHMRCRSIDIKMLSHDEPLEMLVLEQLLHELLSETTDVMVALRGRHRWIQNYVPLHLEPVREGNALRHNGVYLITGGLGGIGLALATYLATTVQARLILTARAAFPAGCTPEQLAQVRALEALGAEVVLEQADVCDEKQMQGVVERALSRFGAIHGVFHLAGIPATGLMQLKSMEAAAAVLAPKVLGVRVLERVLRMVEPDFLVLFSSLSAATGGGPGQVDYCAANAFLDAYAHGPTLGQGRVVSINWGEWQWNAWEAGLEGYPQEARQYFQKRREQYGIRFEQGCEALMRILDRGLQQVVVSTEDFPAMVEGSKNFSIDTILQEVAEIRQPSSLTLYANDARTVPYVPASNEMEQELVRLWGELLGIELVGVHDNFFEVGGHSLMGTQLIARLRKLFQIDIRLATLFEAPTIAELAVAIELLLIEQIEEIANV